MSNINRRIVHFDLKGAPWKVPYLKEVISVAKQWGATGILFEWEDSFPYTGSLINIGSLGGSSRDGLYSVDEVKNLLQFTVEQGLEPIQLVQSLGHLEFVLKHDEFAHLRELRYYPSVLCPTRQESRDLIVAMVKQALELQPGAKFIHIGADEAWHLNKCSDCIAKSSFFGLDALFISHITAIADEIKLCHPNITVLIWDDMMRGIKEESLQAAGMSDYVTPVVWNYGPVGGFNLDLQMWLKYERCFSEMWVASAYKGAMTSCQMLPSVERYVSNQQAWIEQLRQLEGCRLQINTVVLTGWSRFDHYATLCELLPVSLQSLTSCLKMWIKPEEVPTDWSSSSSSSLSSSRLARGVSELHAASARANHFLHGDQVQTWLNPWQLAHNYTTPMQLIPIANSAKLLVQELNVIRADLSVHLRALTGPRSADEWLLTNIEPQTSALQKIVKEASERAEMPPSIAPTVVELNVQES